MVRGAGAGSPGRARTGAATAAGARRDGAALAPVPPLPAVADPGGDRAAAGDAPAGLRPGPSRRPPDRRDGGDPRYPRGYGEVPDAHRRAAAARLAGPGSA